MSKHGTTKLEDYDEAAQEAEREGAWTEAATLYRRAAKMCRSSARASGYMKQVETCDREIAIDTVLAEIARRTLGISMLKERKSDVLDFREVAVWSLRNALREAYKAGCEASRR